MQGRQGGKANEARKEARQDEAGQDTPTTSTYARKSYESELCTSMNDDEILLLLLLNGGHLNFDTYQTLIFIKTCNLDI